MNGSNACPRFTTGLFGSLPRYPTRSRSVSLATDLDVAEDEPLRTCASTCAGTGKASKGWRWMRWGLGVSTASKAGRAIWQSLAKVPVGAARLNGERRERRRVRVEPARE